MSWLLTSPPDYDHIQHVVPVNDTHDHFIGGEHELIGICRCECKAVAEPQYQGPLGLVGWVFSHNAYDGRD